jgi:hypothetical protein
MTTPNSKPFYMSMTLWGIVVTVIAGVFAHFGYTPSERDQATSAKYIDLISKIIELGIGPLIAIIGRLRAKRPLTITPGAAVLLLPLLFCVGCTNDPVSDAAELRAMTKEAQVQIDQLCSQPGVNETKCAELHDKLKQAEPFVDAIEVAAARYQTDPTKFLDFQTLYMEYKPKVRALLISILVHKYLGL